LSSHIDPLRYKISWVGSEHPTPRSEIAAAGSPSGIELSATSSKLGTVYSTILPKSLIYIEVIQGFMDMEYSVLVPSSSKWSRLGPSIVRMSVS